MSIFGLSVSTIVSVIGVPVLIIVLLALWGLRFDAGKKGGNTGTSTGGGN